MFMGSYVKYSCIILLTVLFGCSNGESSVSTIKVDMSMVKSLDLQLPHVSTIAIQSENIGLIRQFEVKDSIALMRTDKVLSFNVNTGKQITEYSRRGRANDEYLSAWNVGFEDGMIYIYDMNAKKVMYFSYNGDLKYIKTTPLNTQGKPFQQMISYKDKYIGQRVFGVDHIPELALYDSNFVYIADVSDFILRSSNSFGSRFYKNYKGGILFNRAFLNDIYEVSDKAATIRYIVDFGEYSIPNLYDYTDEIEIIQFINKKNNKFATLINNIYESANYIGFSCLFGDKGLKADKVICIYDKSSEETMSFLIKTEDTIIQQIVFDNDIVYILHDNERGDCFLSRLHIDTLMGAV